MVRIPTWFIALGFTCALIACSARPDTAMVPRSGPWHMELDLSDSTTAEATVLPFSFDMARDSAGWLMRVHNGSETIVVNEVSLRKDSLRIRMPLFDSEFKGVLRNDSTITGTWFNYLKGPNYRIPFSAKAGRSPRFPGTHKGTFALSGPWEAHFSLGTMEVTNAIGTFQQADGRVTGTFATECGDYRFLEGVSTTDSLFLSCFDGSHAFLFKAAQRNDSLVGRFWSGNHWNEPWVAVRNPDYRLRNEDSLTYLKEGYSMVDFHFPGIDGGDISPMARGLEGTVRVVQVMGSWCPNCVDESLLLKEMYEKFHARGLNVMAVAFERQPERLRALAGLKRFKKQLAIPYPISYAGDANKDVASEKLPFLNHIMGYPTCIFIGRDGMVRRIHTGFYGPGTGEHYEAYRRELDRFLTALLDEPAQLAASKH